MPPSTQARRTCGGSRAVERRLKARLHIVSAALGHLAQQTGGCNRGRGDHSLWGHQHPAADRTDGTRTKDQVGVTGMCWLAECTRAAVHSKTNGPPPPPPHIQKCKMHHPKPQELLLSRVKDVNEYSEDSTSDGSSYQREAAKPCAAAAARGPSGEMKSTRIAAAGRRGQCDERKQGVWLGSTARVQCGEAKISAGGKHETVLEQNSATNKQNDKRGDIKARRGMGL